MTGGMSGRGPLRSQPVSSLASAPERAAPGDPRAAQSPSALRLTVGGQWLVAAALAAGLIVVAFVTKAGDDLAPNTWAQIVLVLIGAAAAITVLVVGAPVLGTGWPPSACSRFWRW